MNKLNYDQLQKRVEELEHLHAQYESVQQHLKIARERLDLSLSAGNLAWWEFDIPTGQVTYNENKVRILGYPPRDFPNPCSYKVFMDLVHPDDYENTMNAMRDHLSGKKDLYETEYRIRTIDGDYKWYYDRGSITSRDSDGKPLSLKGIIFDITSKKQQEIALVESEKALKESNATKDKLFSIISHDLRSSIGNLVHFLKFMLDDQQMFDKDEFQQMIASLHESSLTTYEMLENLLVWARSQKDDTLAYHPEKINLLQLLDQILHKLENAATQKDISIHTDIPSDLECTADSNMLKIALRNIITNAIKFSPQNRDIYIRAYRKNLEIVIDVQDNGIGMDEEKVQSLFTIHSVHSSSGTAGEKGSGLGLIMCKELIEKQNGRIVVESTPGEGSCFSIRLPA